MMTMSRSVAALAASVKTRNSPLRRTPSLRGRSADGRVLAVGNRERQEVEAAHVRDDGNAEKVVLLVVGRVGPRSERHLPVPAEVPEDVLAARTHDGGTVRQHRRRVDPRART